MTTPTRDLPKTRGAFAPAASVPAEVLAAVEGKTGTGLVKVKPMIVGEEALMLEIWQEKGVRVPTHRHDDHESVLYLVRGRMELTIDGETRVAEAGDTWIHRRGVPHSSIALEECVTIEVKTPPRKTW